MPDTLEFSGARVPLLDGSEANDVPADLLRFGDDIDQLLVLKATSTADRNARFADVAAGTIVSCAAESAVWQKTTTPPTAAAWLTLFEDAAAGTGTLATAATNFTLTSEYGRLRNGLLSIRFIVDYNAADVVADSEVATLPGNITDTKIATILTAWRPPVIWNIVARCNAAAFFGYIHTNGEVFLTTGVPSGKLRTGDSAIISTVYPKV